MGSYMITNNEFDFGKRIVVASLTGTLPMGGMKANTPIYALDNSPESLTFNANDIENQEREDVNLKDLLAFTIENVITKTEANTLIALTERLGYREDAPGIRTPPGMRLNKTVHWVSDDDVLKAIFSRISPHLPQAIDGKKLSPRLSHRINFYKYDSGDIFKRHVDGDWPGYGLDENRKSMVQWNGVYSKITMLLYLNGHEDGVIGGSTKLFGHYGEIIEVIPKKGRALFFKHGLTADSVHHEGSHVRGKTPKYVARINIMYESV